MKRILIADDHPIFRKGLAEVIGAEADYTVIAECGDGPTARKLIAGLAPDVALLDIQMPGMSGFDVLKEVKAAGSSTAVIFLTMHSEEEVVERAISLGAKGFLLKESVTDEILLCLRAVFAQKSYLSGPVSDVLVRMNERLKNGSERTGLSRLTSAERRVLTLISEKRSSKEIAEILFVSVRTVENHRNNICNKLDLHGPNALLAFALEHRHLLL